MNSILNMLFPDGYIVLVLMFVAVFALGAGAGLALQRGATKGAVAGAVMACFIVSFVCYKTTIVITEADKPLAVSETPMSSEDRYNAILADNGPSNYGDDLFKIQQH